MSEFDFSKLTEAEKAEFRHEHAKATTGLIEKFTVVRTDGRSSEGEAHYGCRYFVLDLDHDPFALPAIEAYAKACDGQYRMLAHDLEQTARAMRQGKNAGTWPKPKRRPR